MSNIILELEKEQLRTDLPELEVGDTVRVFVKVIEGNRERLQNFEGVVIKIQGGGIRKSPTRPQALAASISMAAPNPTPPIEGVRGGSSPPAERSRRGSASPGRRRHPHQC